MDQYYVDSAYWDERYTAYVAEAKLPLDLYIEQGYFTPDDYYEIQGSIAQAGLVCEGTVLTGVTVEAIGNWQAEFTQTTDNQRQRNYSISVNVETDTSTSVNRIRSDNITLTASFDQSATISHIEGADLFAFTEAELEAQVNRIRDNNVAVSSVFDVGIETRRTLNFDADSSAFFDISTISQRSRAVEILSETAFSFEIDANVIKQSSVTLDADVVLTVEQQSLTGFNSDLISEFDLTVEALKIKNVDAGLSVESSLDIDYNRLRATVGNLETVTDQTLTYQRQRSFDATIENNIDIVVVTEIFVRIVSDLSASVEVIGTAVKTATIQSDINCQTVLNSNTRVISDNAVEINSQTDISATIGSIKQFDCGIESTTSKLVVTFKNATGTVLMESSSTVTASPTRIKDFKVSDFTGIEFDGGSDIGDHFIQITSRSNIPGSYTKEDTFLIAFWAYNPQGIVLRTNNTDLEDSPDGDIRFINDDFVFRGIQTEAGSIDDGRITTWKSVRQTGWAHYMLYQRESVSGASTNSNLQLYVNGQLQSVPTVQIISQDDPKSGLDEIRLWQEFGIAYPVLKWTLGAGLFGAGYFIQDDLEAQSVSTMTGAVSQFVAWWNPELYTNIPDVTNPSVREKIYNIGYVNLGTDGTLSGLSAPNIYLRLNGYDDTEQRGSNTTIQSRWLQISEINTSPTNIPPQIVFTNYAASEADVVYPGLISTSVINAQATRIKTQQANLTVSTELNCTITRSRDFSIAVESNLAVDTKNTRIRENQSDLNCEFTHTVNNFRIRPFAAVFDTDTNIATIAFKVIFAESRIESSSNLETSTSRTRDVPANLTLSSTIIGSPNKLVGAGASILSQGFVIGGGYIIHIDPFYQIKVEQESRQGTVTPENRVFQVEQETRLNMII